MTEAAISRPVFVSYASADAAATTSLVSSLEAVGLVCWLAPRDVTPGASYAAEIVRGIDGSRVTVLVLSANAVASPHVLREIERCTSKRHPIVSVRIDQASLTPDFEYFLNSSHWLDASGGVTPTVVEALATAVRSMIGANESTPGPAQEGPARPRVDEDRARSSRRLVTSLLAVAAVLVAGMFGWRFVANHEVRRPSAVAPTVERADPQSIAVLPFEDISPQQDQKYFARGIAQEVLGRLAKIPGLKVIGRSSSFQYDTRNADAKAIGKALGATYLLEGTVRHDGDRVKVSAEMLGAGDGSLLWSDTFDVGIVDVGPMQDTIAAGLARALQISLDIQADPRRGQSSAKVYDFYLRGLQALSQGSEASSSDAVAYFQQALTLDPKFVQAAIGLGQAYVWIGHEAWQPPRAAFAHAREATELALTLDPKNARAYLVRADVRRVYDWDWEGTRKDLDSAFALAPRESEGVRGAAYLAAALGDWEKARALAKEALALDPLNYMVHELKAGFIDIPSGRYADAERELTTALQIAPRAGNLRAWLGKSLLLQKRYAEALAAFAQETRDDGQLEGSAMAYFAMGKRKESDQMLAAATEHNASVWASEIARVHAYRGEVEQALQWLDRAYEQRDEDLWCVKGDPFFSNLAGEPRFQALLRKMNLSIDPSP